MGSSSSSSSYTTTATLLQNQVLLWELPDVVLFHVTAYVAPPTHRAHVLCQQIGPLCSDSYRTIVANDDKDSKGLWETLLREDYGIVTTDDDLSLLNRSSISSSRRSGRSRSSNSCPTRRHSKRLKRSPLHKVRDAHQLIKDNTEIAFFYLSEMVNNASSSSGGGRGGRGSSSSRNNSSLSLSRFVALLNEYGPHLRVNNVQSNGGVYLVEVIRAKNVKENTILKCVKELVENRNALVNISSQESSTSCHVTPLCVAAARGMPSVVTYLLSKGADSRTLSSGRFRLQTNKSKTVACQNKTPHHFALMMRQNETIAGANERRDLRKLNQCIRILAKVMRETSTINK